MLVAAEVCRRHPLGTLKKRTLYKHLVTTPAHIASRPFIIQILIVKQNYLQIMPKKIIKIKKNRKISTSTKISRQKYTNSKFLYFD